MGGVAVLWWEAVGYALLAATALGMRLWDLGSRAMHHDESLHAYFSYNLYKGKGFQHNPLMHGPFQFEANAAIFFIFGDSDFTARLLYVLMGSALVVLPFFLRRRLGRIGALMVSLLLAFSPAMLYYSRFARNDILMAVWTLALVICMWRYIDEGRDRYLYIAAGVLAFAFATKETAYMLTAILGLYLLLRATPTFVEGVRERLGDVRGRTTPEALSRLVGAVWAALRRPVDLTQVSRPTGFMLFLMTMTLPQWSALVGVFQNTPLLSWSGLVLVSPEGGPGPVGSPVGGGLVIATAVVVFLLWVSVLVGTAWKGWAWVKAAVIFYVLWTVLYTTGFTNIKGIGSGVWQGLGYWLAQQGVARGNQPWYYYFVLTPIYEFLPLVLSLIGGIYYLRRRDEFGHFLVFWAVATFFLYTLAAEKMPWLLVNVTLPLIVLGGRFLGHVVQGLRPQGSRVWDVAYVIVGVPLLLVVLWRLAFFEPSGGLSALVLILLLAVAGGLAYVGYRLYRLLGPRAFWSAALVSASAIMLVLTVRAGATAAYRNGDIPVEMMVYTQTSPDVTRLLGMIQTEAAAVGNPQDLAITIDSTSGFTWPWAWYLREYKRVGYPAYSADSFKTPPQAAVLLVHGRNRPAADPVLREAYTPAVRVRHRWWFPERTYRDLTLGKFLSSFFDRGAWRRAMDYFLYRKLGLPLGSEDSYVYFSKDMPLRFTPAPVP